jgi:uncharacterized protein (DUF488 family)
VSSHATTIYTIGHSVRTADDFFALLEDAGIELLVDVRRLPQSRRNPHFGRDALQQSCATHGIRYRHAVDLGGHRESVDGSRNLGLPDGPFRGYADHTATAAFAHEVAKVVAEARAQNVAVMCAEASPKECHRSILADWLVAHGHRVVHLRGAGQREDHVLDPHVKRDAHGVLVWHAKQSELFG